MSLPSRRTNFHAISFENTVEFYHNSTLQLTFTQCNHSIISYNLYMTVEAIRSNIISPYIFTLMGRIQFTYLRSQWCVSLIFKTVMTCLRFYWVIARYFNILALFTNTPNCVRIMTEIWWLTVVFIYNSTRTATNALKRTWKIEQPNAQINDQILGNSFPFELKEKPYDLLISIIYELISFTVRPWF